MAKQLKPSTVEFIWKLLNKELEAEWVYDSPKPNEVEYLMDLEKAAVDFADWTGDWVHGLAITDWVKKIHGEEK